MRWKRGDLELRYIVLLILAVVVVIAVIILFRSQINHFMKTIFDIGKEITESRPKIGDIIK